MFVADWHAETTHYGDVTLFLDNVIEMMIDWLTVGVNPGSAALFIQCKVPEHAELNLLLSMITPKGWLERVLSCKDQQPKLQEKISIPRAFSGIRWFRLQMFWFTGRVMCLLAPTR